eukprot:TRINITY_DN34602_c0_g1_i1.p1 TRINITY_DN34602_c0_g1~~TRINITY_DN34602_c0_g1_i1.p1  ORF type:complete len:550 (+),score=83.85 TRINITY_DN34602_c0_g1_i1:208-1650(+)
MTAESPEGEYDIARVAALFANVGVNAPSNSAPKAESSPVESVTVPPFAAYSFNPAALLVFAGLALIGFSEWLRLSNEVRTLRSRHRQMSATSNGKPEAAMSCDDNELMDRNVDELRRCKREKSRYESEKRRLEERLKADADSYEEDQKEMRAWGNRLQEQLNLEQARYKRINTELAGLRTHFSVCPTEDDGVARKVIEVVEAERLTRQHLEKEVRRLEAEVQKLRQTTSQEESRTDSTGHFPRPSLGINGGAVQTPLRGDGVDHRTLLRMEMNGQYLAADSQGLRPPNTPNERDLGSFAPLPMGSPPNIVATQTLTQPQQELARSGLEAERGRPVTEMQAACPTDGQTVSNTHLFHTHLPADVPRLTPPSGEVAGQASTNQQDKERATLRRLEIDSRRFEEDLQEELHRDGHAGLGANLSTLLPDLASLRAGSNVKQHTQVPAAQLHSLGGAWGVPAQFSEHQFHSDLPADPLSDDDDEL